MTGMAILLVSVRSTGWTRSLTTMAAGDSLLLGLFLANSSTDSDQQHYLCSTTQLSVATTMKVTIAQTVQDVLQIVPFFMWSGIQV